VPEAIAPGAVTDNWWATKRAVLGSGIVLTSPGIPMLFQGQELLEDRWFDDTVSLDWDKTGTNRGIVTLHRDLIALRRARDGATRGLRGPNVRIIRADNEAKILAMHRWMEGGPHDDTVVVANFAIGRSTTCRSGSRRPAAGTCASTPTHPRMPTCSAATRRSILRRRRTAAGRPRPERRSFRSAPTAW
jgi:1,4-alpha-glucan branching enzyme